MADKILHKRSLTPGSIPTTSSLDIGELAINVNDGKLYLHQSGSIAEKIITVGESASYASTASYVETAQTASYVLNAVSSSFAASSSFALTASYVANASSFPFTGSALITGSLGVTGSLTATQIGAGAAPSGSIRLDVRASSSAATDVAFRVRNSNDTENIFEILGTGKTQLCKFGNGVGYAMPNTAGVEGFLITTENTSVNPAAFTRSHVLLNSTEVWIRGATDNTARNVVKFGAENYGGTFVDWSIRSIAINDGALYFNGGTSTVSRRMFLTDSATLNIGKDSMLNVNSGTNQLRILNGTAPSSLAADTFALYSTDRNGIAGKASPHFRTEDGTIVWLGDESRLFNVTASRTIISSSQNTASGSSLTVYGSGSAQPVFTVQGSQGELFSVTDSLSGSLFSVNDISGLPILEVFSDNTTLIGNYLDPMLITTAKVTQTNSGSFVMYSLPTASYDTAFFEYSVKSGSNARAGTIMAIQSGSAVNFTETTTTDFGNTSAISFTVIVTGSNIALTGSSTTGSWTIKTIVRGL
jgi:hypothetical protein